ncbi:MAG: DnaJ domain-containing protein [Blastocatellia bacterium]
MEQQTDTPFKIENRLLEPDEIKQLANLIIDEPDHYTVLGVDRYAAFEAINQSYCLAVNYFHPLKYQPPDETYSVLQWTLSRAIRRIEQAYFILSSRTRRKAYDQIIDHRSQVFSALPKPDEASIHKGNAEIWRAFATQKQSSNQTDLNDESRSQENRRVTRVTMQIPVIVTLEPQWQEVAESLNISPLGIKLVLSHPVEPGTLLRLELPMPVSLRAKNFEDEIYTVNAYVLYVTERNNKRLVAAEFV